MGAPLHWLGASPVLVFNLVLLLGFALTAWAGYALAFEWTGDRAAGMLAGSMFAFNTHTLTRLAHVQGIHAWGLPLALLAADRILVHARWRDAVLAGRLDDGDGIHVRLSHRLRRDHDRGRRWWRASPDWWPRPGRVAMLFAGATAPRGGRRPARVPALSPRRAELGMVRPDRNGGRVLRHA